MPHRRHDKTRSRGQPRKYANNAEKCRAYRQRRKQAKYFRAQFTGAQEWYTPAVYLEAAREVLGAIDLDPASSLAAQEAVQAARWYTAEEDGLLQAWQGRVWLNPPYTQPLIERFVRRLVAEVEAGHVSAAILLTHNYSDTAWFQLAQSRAQRLCFTKGRIRFLDAQGQPCAPTQGQVFFYFGPEVERFTQVFSTVGFIR